MKTKLDGIAGRYQAALRRSLKQGAQDGAGVAHKLGSQAATEGLDASDLAKIHEKALLEIMSPDGQSPAGRNGALKGASKFFVKAIDPIEKRRRAIAADNARLKLRVTELGEQAAEQAASNRRMEREIARRKKVEESLQKSKQRNSQLLAQSRLMQGQLKHLSHQIILAQEDERKEISRQLHDQIAQILTGINVHLAALREEDAANTKALAKKIVITQRLVEKSVNIVHRFARDLRPTILDDLGLIPALHAFVKEWTRRTGIPVRFAAFPEIERLGSDKRTALYRVAQAALTNVAEHAKATEVFLSLRRIQSNICMEVHDNGKSFDVERVLFAKRHKRLGVIGMRERVEMVGGVFAIESAPGKGTTIRALIPSRK